MRGGRPTPCGPCPKPILDHRNEWIWDVFQSLSTQSRLGGMGGFTGFDYTALPLILETKQVPRELWDIVLEAIEHLTQIAVKCWNKSDN